LPAAVKAAHTSTHAPPLLPVRTASMMLRQPPVVNTTVRSGPKVTWGEEGTVDAGAKEGAAEAAEASAKATSDAVPANVAAAMPNTTTVEGVEEVEAVAVSTLIKGTEDSAQRAAAAVSPTEILRRVPMVNATVKAAEASAKATSDAVAAAMPNTTTAEGVEEVEAAAEDQAAQEVAQAKAAADTQAAKSAAETVAARGGESGGRAEGGSEAKPGPTVQPKPDAELEVKVEATADVKLKPAKVEVEAAAVRPGTLVKGAEDIAQKAAATASPTEGDAGGGGGEGRGTVGDAVGKSVVGDGERSDAGRGEMAKQSEASERTDAGQAPLDVASAEPEVEEVEQPKAAAKAAQAAPAAAKAGESDEQSGAGGRVEGSA
jgi:hypothetical protein